MYDPMIAKLIVWDGIVSRQPAGWSGRWGSMRSAS